MSLNLVNGTITDAGADYLTQRIATMSPVTVSHFILANIPDVDETTPADAAAGMPDAEHIVNDNVPVFRLSYNDHSAVVYSIVLGSGEGNYDFNYYGAVTDTGVLLAYCHIPLVKKRAGLGQLLNRNMLVTFSAAQALTGADIPAEAWQFDFSEALADAVVSVTGPGLIYAGSTTEYQITDYDEFSLYHVASSVGAASIADSTVTLTLPPDADSGICFLDITRAGTTRRISIAVGEMNIKKPAIIAPLDGAENVIVQPVFELSEFATYPAGSDTLASTSARIFNAGGTLIWESTKPAGEPITPPNDLLQRGTLYKWQGMQTGTTLGSSEWTELASFTTIILPDVGEAFGGGFAAGIVRSDVDGHNYMIIVSDGGGDSTQLGAPLMKWKTANTADSAAQGVAPASMSDGFANFEYMKSQGLANYPFAEWVQNTINAGDGLNGQKDWYPPSRDELEIVFRKYKPTTQTNSTSKRPSSGFGGDGKAYGTNDNAVPASPPYTASNPAQTNRASFQAGGPDALNASNYYWSSSETTASNAWVQTMGSGYQSNSLKANAFQVRVVRRVRVF